MTTPAVVPATPAAAPEAPAAAPAAPVAVAAPPVAVAPAVAPVAAAPLVPDAPPESLIPADPAAPAAAPQTDAQRLEAARALVKAAETAADPNGGKAWLLHDGVMGQGEKPSWFKDSKYKTVSAQAEAYTSLESRFGSFVGAPKDGKYSVNLPEGVRPDTVIDQKAPMYSEFSKWAADHQLSQDGFNDLLGFLALDVARRAPNMAAIKGRLGENADDRISNTSAWIKANLGAEGFALFRDATVGSNADSVFKLAETMISKSGQVRMPKPGGDVPNAQAGAGLDAIKAMQAEKLPNGKRRYVEDAIFRAEVEKKYREHFASEAA